MRRKYFVYLFIIVVIYWNFLKAANNELNNIEIYKGSRRCTEIDSQISYENIDLGTWTQVNQSFLLSYPNSLNGQKIR